MVVGRLVADHLVNRFVTVHFIRACGLIAAAGMSLAILLPYPISAGIGLVLVGLGLAPILPVVYSEVGKRHPTNTGPAIAAVTTVAYSASVVAPISIGGIAELLGLRLALILISLFALLMSLLAARLGRRE
jgi:MFS family permease